MKSDAPDDSNIYPSERGIDETRLGLPRPPESMDDDATTGRQPSAILVGDDDQEIPFLEGDLIGRYEVIKVLGSGGFGHVFLARDPMLKRKVAIKYPRLDEFAIQKQAFIEEGRSIARLNHPSIVRIFNIEETLICLQEPRPPRSLNPSVSPELERICLK